MIRALGGALVLLLCLNGRVATAQETAATRRGATWSVWAGLAQNSPTNLWGAAGDHDFAIVALRLARPIAYVGPPEAPRITVDYVMDLVPGAWLSMPRAGGLPAWCGGLPPGEPCSGYGAFAGTDAVYGFGVAPLGLQARLRAAPWAEPYVAASAGLLRFARPVPVDGGARLNFTAEAGGGLLLHLPERWGLTLGYKFHHISNARTASRNPGVDGHMLVLGVQRSSP